METSSLPALIPAPVPPSVAFTSVSTTVEVQAPMSDDVMASDSLLASLEAARAICGDGDDQKHAESLSN